MNSLKQTIIENFQSHSKTVINWAPSGQLTVITGATDSGKTAIIRALRWLCNNTPQGDDFIRVGCTFARVTNIYESGHKVIRERSASKNQYKIIAPGATEPLIFEGFGNNVPLEVQEITGISPVQIGDEKYNLNIVDQLAGPFLGNSISAPARAKVLGKMAGTEEIDHANKQTGTDLLNRGKNVKDLIADLATLAESIKGYDYLPQMVEKIAILEQLSTLVKSAEERRQKLTDLQGKLILYSQAVNGCKLIIDQLKNISLAQTVVLIIEEGLNKSALISQAANRLNIANSQIKYNSDVISGLAKTDSVCTFIQVIDINRTRYTQLTDLQIKFNFHQDKINLYKAMVDSLTAIPDVVIVIDKLNISIDKRRKLAELKEELQQKEQVLLFANELLSKLVDIEVIASKLPPIQDVFVKRDQLKGLFENLSIRNRFIQESKDNIIFWENRTIELEKAYNDALVSLGMCPTCGAIIDPLNIQHLKKAS